MDTGNFSTIHNINIAPNGPNASCASPSQNIGLKVEVLSDEYHDSITAPLQVFRIPSKANSVNPTACGFPGTYIEIKTEIFNDKHNNSMTATSQDFKSAPRLKLDTGNGSRDDPSLNLNIKSEVFDNECDSSISETPQVPTASTATCNNTSTIVDVKTEINECDSSMADTSEEFHHNPTHNTYIKTELFPEHCDSNMTEPLHESSVNLNQPPACNESNSDVLYQKTGHTSDEGESSSDFEPLQALKSAASRKARCVNCGLNILKMKRHQLNVSKVRQLIQRWVKPYQVKVSKKSLVCSTCWCAAWTKIRDPKNKDPVPFIRHRKICIICGKSVLNKKSKFLKSDTPEALHIRNVVASKIPPHLLSDSTEICCPCWMKCDRQASNSIAPRELSKTTCGKNVDTEDSNLTVSGDITRIEPHNIILPNYVRAPSTHSRCFFPSCNRTDRNLVPSGLRITLFCDYKYYVPKGSRICQYHLRSNSWHLLDSVDNPIRSFSAEHIEDFISLLINNRKAHLDFENIENMPEHLVKYYLGITKEQFQTMLNEVPDLASRHRGSFALAAHLLKLKTGDSFERISGLLQVPRSTITALIKMAQEYLNYKNGSASEENGSNSEMGLVKVDPTPQDKMIDVEVPVIAENHKKY